MLGDIFLLGVFPGLLALAAGYDLVSYTIPNRLSLAIALAFIVFGMAVGLPLAQWGAHLAAFAIALVLGFSLFAVRLIGGGDAKLFAATGLWFGLSDLLPYGLIAALCGGGLALALLSVRRLPMPAQLGGYRWVMRLHDKAAGIPYGVALAAGALLLLPEAQIFRLLMRA